MKKLLASLITAALLLVSAGCSAAPGASSNGGQSPASPASPGAGIDYPGGKPITVIVPFSAGGEHDLTARAIGNEMSKWGYSFVIQNTPGPVGTGLAFFQDEGYADGYTLLMHSPEVMASTYACGTLAEPVFRDMNYLGNFVFDAGIICVKADSPYNSFEELAAAAKATPGELGWASVGAAGKNYLDSAQIFQVTGLDFNYIPYNAANESRAAVLGGHADVYYAYVSGAKATVDSGELKVLAVTGEERSRYFPDAPTLKELGYDITTGLTRCWDAHPKTDPAIVEKLTKDLNECLMAEETQKVLDNMGLAPYWMTNEEMHAFGDTWYDNYTALYKELVAGQ